MAGPGNGHAAGDHGVERHDLRGPVEVVRERERGAGAVADHQRRGRGDVTVELGAFGE